MVAANGDNWGGPGVRRATYYHPGWHATIGGEMQRITKDGLGLLVIHPNRSGQCTIELRY
jgi:hypothetical protein